MVDSIVLDTSIVLAWCFEDEQTPASLRLLDELRTRTAIVPALWRWEVGNALLTAERRKRIDGPSAERFLQLLHGLPIQIDEQAADYAWGITRSLARTHHLTAYDAAYLELAIRLNAPLATRDEALIEAARVAGVTLLEA